MTQKDSFLYRVNKICALLLAVWVCWPWFCQNTGLAGAVIFSFGWCATAILVNNKYTVSFDGMLMAFYAVYMAMSFVLTGRTYGSYQLYYHISMVMLFFLPYYMTKFYVARKDTVFMGRLALVALFFMLIGCVTSIYYTAIDENIMKTISQSMDTELVQYRKSGIGSFGFVYMVMFVIIAIVGLFKAKLTTSSIWMKLFLLLLCAVGIKCVFDSTFTTAILLLFFGVLLILITSKRSSVVNLVTYFLFFIGLFVISRFLGAFLSTIQMESADVTIRLREIGSLLLGEEGGTNTTSRAEYFMKSVRCFFENPVLGYNFALSSQYKIGGHSEWIDIFGVYGLVGGIPLIATIVIKLKNIFRITKKIRYPFYGVLVFIFVIFGFVDPFLRLYNIGFGMFFFIPCLGCLYHEHENKREKK